MGIFRSLTSVLTAGLALAAAAPASTTYRISTAAGSDRMGDGGLATAAQFGTLQGLAVDTSGNIYVADTGYHRVRRISAAGIVTTVAGTGVAGYSGDGGTAVTAQLNLPYGLAVDASGYLYIADLGNQRVRRVAPDGTIATYAGCGTKGSTGDGGLATSAQLASPRNLALDRSGNLYIAEFEGHRVRRVTSAGTIATVAGTGVAGLGGDGFAATTALLNYPAGVAVDSAGTLYICDSQNQRVRKVLASGTIFTLLGATSGTALLSPLAVAVDIYGTVYVGDASASVRQLSAGGAWTTTAGTGVAGFSGDGGVSQAARLNSVRDVAVDAAANVLIADSSRVRRVNNLGIISTVAGDGYLSSVGDGGAATDASLLGPRGVALDASGNLYVADSGTGRVRRIGSDGLIATVAGNGTAGFSSTIATAASSPLNTPSGVAAGLAGSVLIADTANQRIRRVSSAGTIATLVGTGTAGYGPDGVAPELEPLNGPRGVCVDAAGTPYAVDTGNHRILRVPSSGTVAIVAGTGGFGDGGDGGAATSTPMNEPAACAFDGQGNLYIADTGNHRVRKVDGNGIVTTVAGTGTAGFSGDEGLAAQALLHSPLGVAAGSDGTVYIADTGNNRIRAVTADKLIHTIAGQDWSGFAGDGDVATLARLSAPAGVAAAADGSVYAADTGNNRIRLLTPVTETAAAASITVASAAGATATAVAPGELIAIGGTSLGPDTGLSGTADSAGLLPTALGETQVLADGVAAPLLYVQASRITAQVPYAVSGKTSVTIEVLYRSVSRGSLAVPVAAAAPALFGSPLNADGTVVSAAHPAPRGSVVTFLATGTGLTDGADVTGLVPPSSGTPLLALRLRIAGFDATLLSVAAAADRPGVLRLDVLTPSGFVPPGEAAVEFTVGTFAAPAATIWLQ
jgi:trimeric autotransporter adhesin